MFSKYHIYCVGSLCNVLPHLFQNRVFHSLSMSKSGGKVVRPSTSLAHGQLEIIGDAPKVNVIYQNFPANGNSRRSAEGESGAMHLQRYCVDPISKQKIRITIPEDVRRTLLRAGASSSIVTHRVAQPHNPYGQISLSYAEYRAILLRFCVLLLVLTYSAFVCLKISYDGSYSSSRIGVEMITFFSYTLLICVLFISPFASCLVGLCCRFT